MYKVATTLCFLSFICWVIQLLPVISVPVSSPPSGLYLSGFRNYTFGVFGICDRKTGVCSDPKIGYPSVNSTFYELADDSDFDYGGVELPSSATYTISKLLVVHVIAFCFSSLLVLLTLLMLVIQCVDDDVPTMVRVRHFLKITKKTEQSVDPNAKDEVNNGLLTEEEIHKPKRRDITPFLDWMLAMAISSFLSNLLGFLADILLFIPNLSWLGWIQLLPIVILALFTSMACFIKRSISSRKFLEDDQKYENDDMRMRNKVMGSRWHDNDSDDGFYVYTNGFYSTQNNQNDNRSTEHAHQPIFNHNNNSSHNGWVHHTYHHDIGNESGDEISLNSSHVGLENIRLNILNRSPSVRATGSPGVP
ncbi:pH-response regulator protein palI/RIM9 [Scheffersomyces xylosifermentans]|uniref:pH-response regulator protein palI/RIM9 n=1 Tax=Scheffersomyces xylosifermentans TaxID=1304137 RepID=UPI00315CB21B